MKYGYIFTIISLTEPKARMKTAGLIWSSKFLGCWPINVVHFAVKTQDY